MSIRERGGGDARADPEPLPRPLPEAARGERSSASPCPGRCGGILPPAPLRGGGRGEGYSDPPLPAPRGELESLPLPASRRGPGGGVASSGFRTRGESMSERSGNPSPGPSPKRGGEQEFAFSPREETIRKFSPSPLRGGGRGEGCRFPDPRSQHRHRPTGRPGQGVAGQRTSPPNDAGRTPFYGIASARIGSAVSNSAASKSSTASSWISTVTPRPLSSRWMARGHKDQASTTRNGTAY